MGQFEFRVLGLSERDAQEASDEGPDSSLRRKLGHPVHTVLGRVKGMVLLGALAAGAIVLPQSPSQSAISSPAIMPAAATSSDCSGAPQTRFDLNANLYELPDLSSIPVFSTQKFVGTAKLKALQMSARPDFPAVVNTLPYFGMEATGPFWAGTSGRYLFQMTSDDGSKLFLDGVLVLDNDGVHGDRTESRTVNLRRGSHTMRVQYIEVASGGASLFLEACRVRTE